MKRFFSIALSVLLWLTLTVYAIFAARECSARKREVLVSHVEISIPDGHGSELVSKANVRQWLEEGGFIPEGVPVADINTEEIESHLTAQPFISTALAYTDLGGKLTIEVTHRVPVFRIITADGIDVYISSDDAVLPHRDGINVYVPVVTGDFMLPFPENFPGALSELSPFTKKYNQSYLYLLKLINFVKMLSGDPFWDAQLVQIDIDGTGIARGREPVIELVTRIGNHRVIFGELDGRTESDRLDKLMIFYEKIAAGEGWDVHSTVDLQYEGQIVCRRNRNRNAKRND